MKRDEEWGARLVGALSETTPMRGFWIVWTLLVVLYLPTATFGLRINVDAAYAAVPAWNLVHDGTLDLAAHRDWLASGPLGDQLIVNTEQGVYSTRHPGVVALGVPFYAAALPWTSAGQFTMVPAAVAAALAAATAMAVLQLVLRRLVDPATAILGACLFGLGTSTWSVSADGLWTHAPSQLWLLLGLLAAASGRFARSGMALGLAILTRPYNAVAAAVLGTHLTVRRRRLWPAVGIAAFSLVGLGVYLAYSQAVFGTASVAGGYAKYEYATNVADLSSSRTSWATLANFLGAFVDPERGMLWYSPFLLVLVPGLPAAWRRSEDWVRASAFGGLGILVLQYWVQSRSQGGEFFFGYRYPLEPLTLAAPLLVMSWQTWVRGHPRRVQAFRVLAVVSIALHAFGASFEPYTWG